MNREQLDELWGRLMLYRELRTSVSPRELEAFAQDIGRVRDNDGNWLSPNFTEHRAIMIPNEPQLSGNTYRPILLELEDDLFEWQEALDSYEEHKNDPVN
jgi:hypothetical protein